MKPNPFDLSNIDDLPDSLKGDLRAYKIDRVEKNIMDLFSLAKRHLTLDEITVSYFRQYGEEISRKQMMTKLYNMSRAQSPLLKTIKGKKGVYSTITQIEDEATNGR